MYDICGGVLDDEDIKAVQTGGPSGGVIPEKHLDTEISYESLRNWARSWAPAACWSWTRFDSMVDVARFYLRFSVEESCGKCAPCRMGGFQMLQLLDKIFRGRGKMEDLDRSGKSAAPCRRRRFAGWGRRRRIRSCQL